MGSDLPGEAIASFVRLLYEVGPNFSEISRRINVPKETIRYWYHKKILAHGFGVYASIDMEKLGLKRVAMIVDFGKEYRHHAQAILIAMNQLCYVTYFERIMPEDTYLVHSSVPEQYLQSYLGLFTQLKEIGLFSSVESYVFDTFRTMPMKGEFYDFDTGRWFYDWKALDNFQLPTISKKEDFDYTDLLIIKELQKDASRSFSVIAKELTMNYRTLNWHYTNHIMKRQLVKGYILRWMGTSYDYKAEKALQRAHRYFNVSVFIKKPLSASLLSRINELPFLWSEGLAQNYYEFDFFFPVDVINECFQYLTDVLITVKEAVKVLILDQTNALSFSIPYHLYDPDRRRWSFQPEILLERFRELQIKISHPANS